MEPTPDTIINTLTNEMEEVYLVFKELVYVNLKGNFCLMKISAVTVDKNKRLFVKDDRSRFTEVHDGLIYCQFIVAALHEALKPIFAPVVIVDEVNETRVLIVDQIK